MKPPPAGWPRISASLYYNDASTAIDWLCRVFGFEIRLKVEGEGGRIEHSELTFEEGLIMVGSTGADRDRPDRAYAISPRTVENRNTQNLCVCIDDVDGHCEKARREGARILQEPTTTDYGEEYWADRTYQAEDPEGHKWWFMQRVRDPQ